MANYKNIEDYRRKKRLGRFFKKSLLVIIILSILIVLLNVLEIFKGTGLNNIIGKEETTQAPAFPLVIKNEQMVDITAFSSNIAILTKTNVLIYNSNGKKTNSFIHGYTNAVLKESNKRILTYDRGGTKFRVDTATGVVSEIKLKNTIITAEISGNGNVAIVTLHDRYACEVVVYDSTLKNQIYRYYATEELSTITFSADEQTLIGGAITTSAGILSTNLYQLNMNEESNVQVQLIKDILPLRVFYNENNRIKIVGKDSIVTYNTETNDETRYLYKGDIQYFINSSNKETILINKNPFNSYSTVTIIDSEGKAAGTYNINDDVLDLYSDGSRIAVLCKTTAYNLDMSLNELNKIDLKKSMTKIVYNGNNLYVLGADTIEQYTID